MPYSYHESTHLSRENSLALKSLRTTGELPNDHYWNALRSKHDANPTRFDKGNYVLGALLDRDHAQRMGTLGANAPLFSNTGFFAYAGAKHALNMARFDHWHPFLGRLFEITMPATPTNPALTSPFPAGQGLIGTPVVNPASPLLPAGSGSTGGLGGGSTGGLGGNGSGGFGGDGGGTGGGGTGGGGTTLVPNAVPEPSSAVLMGLGLAAVLMVGFFLRKGKARPATVASAV